MERTLSASPTRLTILGSGSAVPRQTITSAMIDARLGKVAGWTFRHSGVETRYVCDDEDQIDLALSAARDALAQSGVTPDDITLLLFAAAVPYQSIPATAPLLQQRLGIRDGACMAFDVNSTCLSFMTALDIARRMIGPRQKALIIASEVASRGLPWAMEPATAALFGDGAAAVVISGNPDDEHPGAVLAARMETYPSAYEACSLASGGTRFDFHANPDGFARHSLFHMDGDVLYKLTARHFTPFLDRLLADAGWSRSDVDLVIPHQASPGALAHLAKRCGFSPDIVVNIVKDVGNQIAASIPTALHHARATGRAPTGTKALILGTSAGVSLGGMALIL